MKKYLILIGLSILISVIWLITYYIICTLFGYEPLSPVGPIFGMLGYLQAQISMNK